ncbi:unnamed protein product [Sympodiomycopsis kandeliae]
MISLLCSQFVIRAGHLKRLMVAAFDDLCRQAPMNALGRPQKDILREGFALQYRSHLDDWFLSVILMAGKRRKRCIRQIKKERRASVVSASANEKRRGHSPQARAILERAYFYSKNVTRAETRCLAEATGLQPRQIVVWYQNRRNRKLKTPTKQPMLQEKMSRSCTKTSDTSRPLRGRQACWKLPSPAKKRKHDHAIEEDCRTRKAKSPRSKAKNMERATSAGVRDKRGQVKGSSGSSEHHGDRPSAGQISKKRKQLHQCRNSSVSMSVSGRKTNTLSRFMSCEHHCAATSRYSSKSGEMQARVRGIQETYAEAFPGGNTSSSATATATTRLAFRNLELNQKDSATRWRPYFGGTTRKVRLNPESFQLASLAPPDRSRRCYLPTGNRSLQHTGQALVYDGPQHTHQALISPMSHGQHIGQAPGNSERRKIRTQQPETKLIHGKDPPGRARQQRSIDHEIAGFGWLFECPSSRFTEYVASSGERPEVGSIDDAAILAPSSMSFDFSLRGLGLERAFRDTLQSYSEAEAALWHSVEASPQSDVASSPDSDQETKWHGPTCGGSQEEEDLFTSYVNIDQQVQTPYPDTPSPRWPNCPSLS